MTLKERLAARYAEDLRETDVWRCSCGAANVMTRCGSCGRRMPAEVAFADLPPAYEVPAGVPPAGAAPQPWTSWTPHEPPKPPTRMTRTALIAVGLGAVTQAVVWMLNRTHSLEPTVSIRFSLLVTLGFYGVVALLVAARSSGSEHRPVWSSGHPAVGALVGAGVGTGVALAVLALLSAVSGHLATDAFATIVVSEGTVGRIIVMGVIVVVCAPLIEEWLFRGLVAESLRDHGRSRALLVSAALFSLWHLRLAAFRYYFLLGLLLGALYLKRGLIASMSAHAAFNGTALVAAVVLAHAAPHTFAASGVSLQAPGAWQRVESKTGGLDLALRGPSGSEFVVIKGDLPGPTPTADQLAAAVRARGLPLPGVTPDVATASVVSLPTGRAVKVDAEVKGHKAVILGVPKEGHIWTVVVATAGSPRAARDAGQLLDSIQLD